MHRKGFILALLSSVLALSCERPRAAKESHSQHTFPVHPGKLVRVEARSLDVDVRVANADVITAEVHLSARATSRSQAQRWLARHQPVFDDSADTLVVTVPRRSSTVFVGGAVTRGTVSLAVPPTCRLEVTTSSGDVTIAGEAVLAEEVRLATRSGDVAVFGGVRALVVESTSGDLEITGPPLDLVDVRTTSGDVALRAESRRTLADSTSGDLRLEALAGELSATTTSGDVRATFDALAPGHPVHVTTTSGNITLRLPPVPLRGEVRTTSGRISSRFDGTWERRRRLLTFHAAEEAVHLTVASVSGNIVLARR